MKTITVDGYPGVDSYIWPSFSTTYLYISFIGGFGDDARILHFLWEPIDDLQTERPFYDLNLQMNPDLFNLLWTGETTLIVGQFVYFILHQQKDSEDNRGGFQQIALACFRISPSDHTLTKVSAIKFQLDDSALVLVPRCLDHRLSKLTDLTSTISTNLGVFSIINLWQKKFCLKIYCFYKSQILPIGGTNMKLPGTYRLEPNTEFSQERQNGKISCFFGFRRYAGQGNLDELRVFRYILV